MLPGMSRSVPSALTEARHRVSVLIVCKKGTNSSALRNALISIGFDQIAACNNYVAGLSEAKERSAQLILFDAETPEGSGMSAKQYVEAVQQVSKNPVLIAVSMEPSGEDLFELLKSGAKGFLSPPLTSAALEEVFSQIQAGFELSEEVLQAEDKDEAFAELIREQLDTVAASIKAASNANESADAISKRAKGLYDVVKMAQFFSESDDEALMQKVLKRCLEHAERVDDEAEKSRLRKTREMLKKQRQKK